ncbi:unnamed protein product [Zymoseptoria tritici ST99CH_1E4]|uniref:NACHT domain-containing protein n=1 Tax=Zymoseptoria tritici ST99CH_1E4 TaxID=1276532 RepID=A0A2H1H365_ZYMTR|nr:unnamed protein product [Zymoseptoria tritici ST99CH_1E4]
MATGHPLWDKALRELPKEDQATLKSHWTGSSPEDLIKDIEKHQKATKEKSVIKLRNQKYFVRDVLGKVTTWLQKFVQVGDTIVQHDPGHAALPWAAVRLILQATLNNQEKHAAVVGGLETITHYAAWSKIEEGNLLITYDGHDQLEKEFVKLYAAMLTFMAHAIQFLYSKRGYRVFASLISGDSQLTEDIKSMTKSKLSIEGSTRQILSQTSHKQYGLAKTIATQIADLEQPIIRVEKAIESQSQILDHQMNEEILDWASVIAYQKHLQVVGNKITPGTGQWLLTDNSFTGWQSSSCSEILWLHGSSGTGKSTLVSILLQSLIEAHEKHHAPYPIYFFCSRNTAEPERANPEDILRCLMRQASDIPGGPPLHSNLRARFERRRPAGAASAEEATDIIMNTIRDRPLTYIVIDALDECDPQSRDVLIDSLVVILSQSTSLVKIFVTSRHGHMDITSRMNVYPAVAIDAACNQADVDLYVRNSVRTAVERKKLLRTVKVDKGLEDKIVDSLCRGAQGMFRWVELQIKFLCTLHIRSVLLSRLEKLPPSLQQIYDELYTLKMQEMGEEQAEVTRKILSLLLVAQRPLSTTELINLACAPDEPYMSAETVLEMCFDLVRLDQWRDESNWKWKDTFRFSHLSVREFLESRSAEYALTEMHTMATHACLDLATGPRTDWTDEVPYPVLHWPQHAEIATRGSVDGTIESLDKFLNLGGESFRRWGEALFKIPVFTDGIIDQEALSKFATAIPRIAGEISPMFVVVCYNLPRYLRRLLSEAASLKEVGAKALSLASHWGKIENVRLLLQAGVDVNSYWVGETALMRSSFDGNVEVVEFLLVNGAHIDARDGEGRSALWLTARYGIAETALLLLENGADGIQKDHHGESILEAAAGPHCVTSEVAQLLLERKAFERETFAKAFRAAARNKKVEFVTLFATFASQIGTPGSSYSDALSAASKWGNAQAVKLLLERGTRINADAFEFSVPDLQVLKFLLGYDTCNVFYSGSEAYRFALRGATKGCNLEVFKLLLTYDIEGICTPGNVIFEEALQDIYSRERALCRHVEDLDNDPVELQFYTASLTEVRLIKDLLHQHAAQAADRALPVARRSRSCDVLGTTPKPQIRLSHSTPRHPTRTVRRDESTELAHYKLNRACHRPELLDGFPLFDDHFYLAASQH